MQWGKQITIITLQTSERSERASLATIHNKCII